MQSVLLLGRQPELGIAEVESLYGSSAIRVLHEHAVTVDVDPCLLAYDRLGGSLKFCKLLTTLPTVEWRNIEDFLKQTAPPHSLNMPEGKMRLGLSILGFNNVSLRQLEATGLSVKKAVQKTGRSVRLVPNKTPELSTAQIIHNQLAGPTGWELVLIRSGDQTIIAQTIKVQNIVSYAKRDRERPKRDSRVGMLPPKLAQIIINLAVGALPTEQLSSICDIPEDSAIPRPQLGVTILDPFCGTGVILQEALLDGYDVFGTDLEPRMISYSEANLDWLKDIYQINTASVQLEQGDATTTKWQAPVNCIASELYLGRPFTEFPQPEILAQTITDCNLIIKKFLKNIHDQIESSTRFCIAVPAWQIKPHQFKRLPLIDQISELGYNQVSFEHVGDKPLLYYRSDQIVARELLVLTVNHRSH
jgi:tRNA G10  N-methylase Trm11